MSHDVTVRVAGLILLLNSTLDDKSKLIGLGVLLLPTARLTQFAKIWWKNWKFAK